MDDNCGEWVECMGVVSRRWVWLVGVVVRRYIDFIIHVLLIPTPLVSFFAAAAASLLFVHFLMFFFLLLLILHSHNAFLHYSWALHAIHWGEHFRQGGHCHLVTTDWGGIIRGSFIAMTLGQNLWEGNKRLGLYLRKYI